MFGKMRIKKLTFEGKTYTDSTTIDTILQKNGLSWLNKSEIENAVIEIKDGKLYWYSGIWYYGDWVYGIWLDGEFRYGNWINGIFRNGTFKDGIWHNGIFMMGVIDGGHFLDGEIRNGTISSGKFEDKVEINKEVENSGVSESVLSLSKSQVIRFSNFNNLKK